MTDDPIPDKLQAITDGVLKLQEDFDRFIPHLADALRRDRAFDELVRRTEAAEKKLAARADRPIVFALFQTLSRIRSLDIPEVAKKTVEDELLDVLNKFDYSETTTEIGSKFDPSIHTSISGQVDGNTAVITKVYTEGWTFLGEMLVEAEVQVGNEEDSGPKEGI